MIPTKKVGQCIIVIILIFILIAGSYYILVQKKESTNFHSLELWLYSYERNVNVTFNFDHNIDQTFYKLRSTKPSGFNIGNLSHGDHTIFLLFNFDNENNQRTQDYTFKLTQDNQILQVNFTSPITFSLIDKQDINYDLKYNGIIYNFTVNFSTNGSLIKQLLTRHGFDNVWIGEPESQDIRWKFYASGKIQNCSSNITFYHNTMIQSSNINETWNKTINCSEISLFQRTHTPTLIHYSHYSDAEDLFQSDIEYFNSSINSLINDVKLNFGDIIEINGPNKWIFPWEFE